MAGECKKKGLRLTSRQTFCWFALALIVLRLWTLSGMPIWAQPFAVHDDAMMVDVASRLGGGGPDYDQLTLTKGWSFPFFLAAIHKLRVPYIPAMALLNAVVSLMAVFALSDGEMKPFHYVLFPVLLFNPVMSSQQVLMRVYRNGLSALTAFAVIVSMIAIYRRRCRQVRTWLPWMTAAGAALPAFWYTREDSIWLAPFIAGVTAVTFASVLISGKKRRAAGILAVMLVPVVALEGSTLALRAQREARYGVGITNELTEGEFPRVMRAIYAVKADEEEPLCVAASRVKIRMLYAYSPTLASVREELENRLDDWAQYVRYEENRANGEVENGWFFWCLRDAAQKAGYFSSLEASQAFWKQIADELEAAMDSGALTRRATMPSALMSPWVEGTGQRLVSALMQIPGFVASFDGAQGNMVFSDGRQGKWVNRFEEITGNHAVCWNDESFYNAAVTAMDTQNAIAGVYQHVWPVVSWAGRLCAIALLVLLMIRRGGDMALRETVWMLAGLAGALLVLYGGVAYNHAESCNSIITLYLSAAYPIVLLFDLLAVRGAVTTLRSACRIRKKTGE